jgi:hypothetical protein
MPQSLVHARSMQRCVHVYKTWVAYTTRRPTIHPLLTPSVHTTRPSPPHTADASCGVDVAGTNRSPWSGGTADGCPRAGACACVYYAHHAPPTTAHHSAPTTAHHAPPTTAHHAPPTTAHPMYHPLLRSPHRNTLYRSPHIPPTTAHPMYHPLPLTPCTTHYYAHHTPHTIPLTPGCRASSCRRRRADQSERFRKVCVLWALGGHGAASAHSYRIHIPFTCPIHIPSGRRMASLTEDPIHIPSGRRMASLTEDLISQACEELAVALKQARRYAWLIMYCVPI